MAETSSGGPSTTSQVYGGQLLFEDERFTYAKVSLSDLRTTCVEVKLKAIKTGSATAAAAACCNNGTPGTPGGSGTLGADSKRKSFRYLRNLSYFFTFCCDKYFTALQRPGVNFVVPIGFYIEVIPAS